MILHALIPEFFLIPRYQYGVEGNLEGMLLKSTLSSAEMKHFIYS